MSDEKQPIQWFPIATSSNVVAAAYDDAQHALLVRFVGGRTYAYHGATRYDFDGLIGSDSPGSYVYRNLKRYPAQQL